MEAVTLKIEMGQDLACPNDVKREISFVHEFAKQDDIQTVAGRQKFMEHVVTGLEKATEASNA